MKKLLLALAILFSGITNSYATHLMGAEITYIHVNGNNYEVTLVVYRDCSGVNVSTNQIVTFQSASCGQNFNFTIPFIQTVDVSQVCAGQTTTCNGGVIPGTQQFVYRGIVTLTPCSDWIIHWNKANRNPAITNLVNPNGTNIYIQNTLNNIIGVNNNSPQFFNTPTPYLCLNQLVIYSHAASDIDGDSLYYSFNQPLKTPGPPGTPIPFTSGHTILQPMITTAGMNLNQQTGEMCFTPALSQIAVVSVIIEEFRNGTLIGSQIREMQVIVSSLCSNQNPSSGSVAVCGGGLGSMTIISASPSVDSLDQNSIRMCPNDNVCFEITFSDPDTSDNITVMDNIAVSIPGATWSVANNNTQNPVGTFCWTPTALDSGINIFSIILEDDACPISGIQTFTYDISVFDEPFAGLDQAICGTQAAQLNASGGATYTWFDAATNIQIPVGLTFSCNPCSNPLVITPVTTDYYVLSSLAASCNNTDTVRVTVFPDFVPDAIGDTVLCDYLTQQLNVNIITGPPGVYTYLWNNAATLSNINIQNPIASPTDSTWYVVEITSPDGCTKLDSVLVGVVPPANVQLLPGDSIVCLGNPLNFDVSFIVINDNFDGGFNPSLWSNVQGGSINVGCGAVSGDALYFSGATRELVTNPLSTSNCTFVDFCLFIGNTGSGATCEDADTGEDVILSYSTTGGAPWITIQTFIDTAWDVNNNWQCFSVPIPAGAQSTTTMFKWNQPINSGGLDDVWAIENVNISCVGNTSYNYSWSPITDLSNPAIANPIHTSTGVGTTTYTVTLTEPNSGCSFNEAQDITAFLNTTTTPTLIDTTLCPGNSAIIDAGAGFVTYEWIPTGGNSQIGLFNQTGSFAVIVSDGVCIDTSNFVQISTPAAVTLASFNPDTLCLNASSSLLPLGTPSGGSYTGTGIIGNSFDPASAGIGTHEIIYTYTENILCPFSDTTRITVDACTGINESINEFGIIIYPNPSNGKFTIEKSVELKEAVRVKILDVTSKLILETSIEKGSQSTNIDISKYDSGIYFLQLTINDKVHVQQIFKN